MPPVVNAAGIVLDLSPEMSFRHTFFLELISGRRRGLLNGLVRGCLGVLSLFYRLVIGLRNTYYDAFASSRRRVSCPVISIGNLTVGGTGKTPMAARIAGLLRQRGRKVAILTRGYKGRSVGLDVEQDEKSLGKLRVESDEALVLKRHCPEASIVVDPDRVAAARRAVQQGFNALVLDDGFQHRRLARNLDIVLVDATLPFGFERLLPRGLLREPVKSLRRADLIILTHSDEIDDSARRILMARLKRESGGKPVVTAVHRFAGFTDVKGRSVPVEDAGAMQAVVFAGIANFDSFRRRVESLGAGVLAAYEYPDHHFYSGEEIADLSDVASEIEANVALTTEKDAVKLVGRWNDGACRLLVLNLEIEFEEQGVRILTDAIEEALASLPPTSGSSRASLRADGP